MCPICLDYYKNLYANWPATIIIEAGENPVSSPLPLPKQL
jgi:hypothetical protein